MSISGGASPTITALIDERNQFRDANDAAFDLLEGLKLAWRKVDPKKGDDIAAGFARGTGGIDVKYLIELLGP